MRFQKYPDTCGRGLSMTVISKFLHFQPMQAFMLNSAKNRYGKLSDLWRSHLFHYIQNVHSFSKLEVSHNAFTLQSSFNSEFKW